MKKTILLASILSLIFGIVQAQTYRPGEARLYLAPSNYAAWDSVTIQAKDTAGAVLLDTAITGGGLRIIWAYTVGAWDGQITEDAKMWLTNGDSLRSADLYIVRPIPEIGDTIKGFATPGDAMTLTTGERGAIEDTMAGHAATYKADVSALMTLAAIDDSSLAKTGDAMTLTTGERAGIADSVWDTAEADLLLLFNSADSVKSYSPDSTIFYYSSSTGKKTYTISSGKVTKWVR